MALALCFVAKLRGSDRTMFLPGPTTDGHYQMELACTACHSTPFAGPDELQTACEGCHAGDLDTARDSHPRSKFTDPRNADRTALLDARYCVTCHVEHRPDATLAMGLTIPEDFCGVCHSDIAAERPTHAGMGFETCASAGCHNFHDNRALYEDFLLKHSAAPALLADRDVAERNFASIAQYLATYPLEKFPLEALTASDADAPDLAQRARRMDAELLADWEQTAHAENGVNCSACHAEAADGAWTDHPGYDSCGTCHVNENRNFMLGRHGMRLNGEASGMALPPMRVADARLPMKDPPLTEEMECGSCHPAHRFDTVFAAVEACLGCHDDTHSNAYLGSPHRALSHPDPAGDGAASGAVTCATCHMPRIEESYEWGAYVHVLVQHNQNDNLRPSEKMIRTVCMDCHGLGFSIDALADPALITNNFTGPPSVHVESIDLAEQRRREIEHERLQGAR